MFVVFKVLLWLCMPSTLVLLGLLAVSGWLFWRKQWRPAIVLLLLEAFLLIPMTPTFSRPLGMALERDYLPKPIEQIPQADAIVLLGGGVGAASKATPYPECFVASDRMLMAFRLWKAGKAPIVIPTGEASSSSEKPFLILFGMPESAVICEGKARDTAENASKTYQILSERNCKKVLVVTSSWHMKRTMMLFQSPDMEFIPVGCDAEATSANEWWSTMPFWQKLPSYQVGVQTMTYIKEWLGILFYSIRKPTLSALPKASAPKSNKATL